MPESFDLDIYRPGDRQAVLGVAHHLAVGTASWRDSTAVRQSVVGWVTSALQGVDAKTAPVFVARHEGAVAGFVTGGTRTHWAGDTDAYVGELVVAPAWSGRGLGQQLMSMMEQWARDQGHTRLTLETGAANSRARRFYAELGYVEEEVVLSREL